MSYTIKDIAKITGFSKSTVSAAMNNKPGVSNEARERIMKVIEELNYTPNEFAKSVSNGVYKTIGLIVRDIGNSFYANLYRAVEKVADENGYSIIIVNTNGDEEKLFRSIKNLIGKRVQGIIIDVSSYNEKAISLIKKNNMKCVVFGINSDDFDSVETDDRKAAYNMVQSIVEIKNKKRLAFIGPIESRNIYSKRRLDGIIQYQQQNKDVKLDIQYYDDSSSVEAGYNCCIQLIKNKSLPEAIIAFNDLVAVGVMKGLIEYNISVPNEVLVTGFDDLETVLFPLDTVKIPVYDMGKSACELLIESIETNKTKKMNLVFNAELIIK